MNFPDLIYAVRPERTLQLNLQVPDGVPNPPLVMYIPMGSFAVCPRDKGAWWLTEHGFAVASIDARVRSEAPAPAAHDDCVAAVRWLRENAGKYGYRSDAIAAHGHSAGGLLASYLATTGEVNAACDECGVPHDFRFFTRPDIKAKYAKVTENLRIYLGGPVEERLELARQVSPATHISKRTAPLLLLQGEADATVPAEEMVEYHRLLVAAGVDVTLKLLPGVGHGWDSNLTRADVVSFFNRILRQ